MNTALLSGAEVSDYGTPHPNRITTALLTVLAVLLASVLREVE